jgi:UDP-2,4-diacetamido-2,4,6-trideoxy-beta-L-altropyranose hydrolase
MKIVFRVDASLKMGIGHVMRCLTLADEFTKQKHQVTFICRELVGNLIQLIEKNYSVVTLPKIKMFQSDNFYLNWLGTTQEDDAQQTIKVLPENADYLIVDSYALGEKWHKELRSSIKKIMVIDDLVDRQFDCDILLNQNLGTKQQDYQNKVPNDCQLLLGCEYALLRPEFNELRDKALDKRKKTAKIKNILISLGGSDKENLTYDILQDISNEFNITVVLGGSSPHNDIIKDYAKNSKNIHVIIDANNMAELMLETDLAIGAGGSTSWERCCLGLPTLLFTTAKNQVLIAQNLEKLGAVKVVGNLKSELQSLVNDFSLWHKMSNKAQKICDGLGIERVVKSVK